MCRAPRVRLTIRGHVGRQRRRPVQLRDARSGEDDAEICAVLVDVCERLGAEHSGDRVREPVDQPLFAEVVVHGHHAGRREVIAHRLERLAREHVALQAHPGEARLDGQRIDQREYDEVVPFRGRSQIVPGIIVDDGNARIAVRMIGMPFGAEPQDHRIDVNRVDVPRTVLQRRGDVGAAAGAENQHVIERVAEYRVRPLVEVFLVRDRRHRLVEDVVHLDDGVVAVLEHGDPVVRRPQAAALHAEDNRQREREQREVGERNRTPPLHDERHGGGGRDAEPDQRRQLQPRDDRKAGDAGEAAEQVDHIGAKRRVPGQLHAHPMCDRHEQRGHRDEEQRQQQRAFNRHHRRRRAAREVDRRRARQRDFEPQPIDGDDHADEHDRKPCDELAAARGEQTADADAEKTREQDEIREVREEPHVGGHPADDSRLEEQDQKRNDEQEHGDRLLLESPRMTKLKAHVATRATAVVIVACAVAAANAVPRAAATSLTQAAEQAIGALLQEKVAAGMPAVAVVVVNSQQQLFLGAAGQRDAAAHVPLSADAIFRIAAITKPITSLAAMMLVEGRRVRVDDPVSKYLPEFAGVRVLTTFNDADGTFESRPPARPITIRHLLTHTSGIAYGFVDARLAKIDNGKRTQAELPLLHDPGERFTYGPSTAVLGSVVEKITGQPLDEFFKARIFDPLGMVDTSYTVPTDKHDRVVTLHTRSDAGFTERPNRPTLESRVAGDGGLFSTAADYGRFMQLFLNGGRAGSARLVSESTIRQMLSNQIGRVVVEEQPSAEPTLARPFPFGGGKDAFGFGFQIETARAGHADPELRAPGSASWGGINNTHFWIDPRTGIAAAVLMQVLPYYDEAAIDVLRSVERLVYQHVRARS